jgi:hypothetical protein
MIKGDDKRRNLLYTMLAGAFGTALKHVAQDAGWYIWHASQTRDEFAKALRDTGLVELGMIIWAKPQIVLGWSDYRWAHEPCFYAARQGVKPAWHGGRAESTVWRVAARGPKGEAHTAIGSGIILTSQAGEELYVSAKPPAGRKLRHVHIDQGALLTASGGAQDDLWEVSRDNGHGREAYHPNEKPVELARRALANSTLESQIVLDLFAGAASTVIAAEQTKRVAYAIELDPRYVDVGIRRWQEHTGKAAIHAKEQKSFESLGRARGRTKPKARARAA